MARPILSKAITSTTDTGSSSVRANKNNVFAFDLNVKHRKELDSQIADTKRKKERSKDFIRVANRIGQGDPAEERMLKAHERDFKTLTFNRKQNADRHKDLIRQQTDRVAADKSNLVSVKNAFRNTAEGTKFKEILRRKEVLIKQELNVSKVNLSRFKSAKLFGK